MTLLSSTTACTLGPHPWHPALPDVRTYVGRSLAAYEMRYGVPRAADMTADGTHVATWRYFDPYTFSPQWCWINVLSDARGRITAVSASDACRR